MNDIIVISGGQTGVDQAALEAAFLMDITTGGWAPYNYETLDGPNPVLKTKYGLVEHHTPGYRARTRANVRDSDATLRIAHTFKSAGEQCTLKAIKDYSKPHLDIECWQENHTWQFSKPVPKILVWLNYIKDLRVLNIAGNSEKTCPGIQRASREYLLTVFEEYIK